MRYALAVLSLIFLSACTTTSQWGETQGGAVYTYTKNADGCSVTITSAREVQGGADIIIGPECDVTVSAEKLGGSNDAWAGIVSELIKRLP